MRVGRFEIRASRFPWQKVGNFPAEGKIPEQRFGWKKLGGMGRFGGGWHYELGINIGGSTTLVNLLVGTIRIEKRPLCPHCGKAVFSGQSARGIRSTPKYWHYHKECLDLVEAIDKPVELTNKNQPEYDF